MCGCDEVTSCDATECDGGSCDLGARNVWRQYLSQILNGKSDLRPSTSSTLARYMNCSIDWLLTGGVRTALET